MTCDIVNKQLSLHSRLSINELSEAAAATESASITTVTN